MQAERLVRWLELFILLFSIDGTNEFIYADVLAILLELRKDQ